MIFHILAILAGMIGAVMIAWALYFLPMTTPGLRYVPALLAMLGFAILFMAISHFVG